MHIVVVGAGLIGVTSAYRLQRAGHTVTVVERESAVARGASYANGSMLTPSMADPWNAPGVWKELLRSLGRADAPMLVRPHAIPSLFTWGLRFLAASSTTRFVAQQTGQMSRPRAGQPRLALRWSQSVHCIPLA